MPEEEKRTKDTRSRREKARDKRTSRIETRKRRENNRFGHVKEIKRLGPSGIGNAAAIYRDLLGLLPSVVRDAAAVKAAIMHRDLGLPPGSSGSDALNALLFAVKDYEPGQYPLMNMAELPPGIGENLIRLEEEGLSGPVHSIASKGACADVLAIMTAIYNDLLESPGAVYDFVTEKATEIVYNYYYDDPVVIPEFGKPASYDLMIKGREMLVMIALLKGCEVLDVGEMSPYGLRFDPVPVIWLVDRIEEMTGRRLPESELIGIVETHKAAGLYRGQ